MTWTRLSDDWTDHPKIEKCSEPAQLLWVRGNTYCARSLTNGFIPSGVLHRLTRHPNPDALAAELVGAIPQGYQVGLWEIAEGGWQVHDWLDWNPSRDQVIAKRRADAERQAKHRSQRESRAESRRDIPRESQRESHCPDPDPDPVPDPDRTRQGDLPGVAGAPPGDKGPAKVKTKQRKAKAEPEATPGFATVKACYVAEYERARGVKPPFGAREGKAVKDLLEKLGGDSERACQCIRGAYAEAFWRDKATINSIANDPAKHDGKRTTSEAARSSRNHGMNIQPGEDDPEWGKAMN